MTARIANLHLCHFTRCRCRRSHHRYHLGAIVEKESQDWPIEQIRQKADDVRKDPFVQEYWLTIE